MPPSTVSSPPPPPLSPPRPQTVFAQLYEAVHDGRLTNVYYRRGQLARLRESLVQSRQAVLDGIVQDERGLTAAEAFVELYLTLSAIKRYHDDLQPQQELDVEYSIASGHDASHARRGLGVVAIVPQAHSFLYSVLVPLAAAVATGNAVVVVREQTLQILPGILTSILQTALDPDIFELADGKTVADLTSDGFLVVDQTGSTSSSARANVLTSPSEALSVAVVDRTADLDAAALTLVDARMRFAGRSPHAPDIVLVNEFAKADLLHKMVQHSIRYMTDLNGGIPASGAESAVPKRPARPLAGIKTVTTGSDVCILDVVDRNALSSIGKVRSATLYIHAVRSLDDAIEVANSLSSSHSHAAAFAFGDLKTCKYLLQFLDSDVGFANCFPAELFVGPVAPRGRQPSSLSTRYPVELFSVPRPGFVQETNLTRQVVRLLAEPAVTHAQIQESLLKELDLEPRVPVRHIQGYFETAALVGLVTIATPVLLSLGSLAWMGARRAYGK